MSDEQKKERRELSEYQKKLSEESEEQMLKSFAKAGVDAAKKHAAMKEAGTLLDPDKGIAYPEGDDCLGDLLTTPTGGDHD